MHKNGKNLLVILAGGQSRRMGQDKAAIEINGARMIDLVVGKFQQPDCELILSAPTDYGTGLRFFPDDPDSPPGPVGAIFSIAAQLRIEQTHKNLFLMYICQLSNEDHQQVQKSESS